MFAGPSLSVVDYRCDAGPHDRPFIESHGGFNLSYVRRGTFGYRVNGRASMINTYKPSTMSTTVVIVRASRVPTVSSRASAYARTTVVASIVWSPQRARQPFSVRASSASGDLGKV